MQRPPGQRAGWTPNWTPPPKICNRVANCVWDRGWSGCECEKWPQWLSQIGMPTGRAELAWHVMPNIIIDPFTMSVEATRGTVVSYYRPSGSKGLWFPGIVQSAWSVKFPTGCCREVVAIN